jgi:competence protein ComEA
VAAWLQRFQWAILAAAVAALLTGIAFRHFEHHDPPAIVFEQGPALPIGAPIRVQVDGAVQSPGVYDLKSGDRVVDAITAAGGASAEADIEALNQARWLRDGEKLTVPASTRPEPDMTALPAGQLLDINSATAAQLDQLPGIGEAYSQRIVDSREADGLYTAIDDLPTRKVLPQGTFDQIKNLISVGP